MTDEERATILREHRERLRRWQERPPPPPPSTRERVLSLFFDGYGLRLWAAAVIGALVLTAGLAAIGVGAHYSSRYGCHQRGEMMGREVAYRVWTGCYVQTSNGFVPLDTYRLTDTED